jgi:hypothetical protein
MKKLLFLICATVVCLAGCGSAQPYDGSISSTTSPMDLPTDPPPAAPSSNTLPNYDAAATQLLDQNTQLPTSNDAGQIVWNTRYYMESLLTAYYATGNQKYTDSLITTGNAVLGDIGSLTVPNVVDPSAPSNSGSTSQITVTGWPTMQSGFGQAVAIPTTGGATSIYAQTLLFASGPTSLSVVASPSGGVLLNWTRFGTIIATDTATSTTDLQTIADRPLDYFASTYRIFTTGAGLPAPGSYNLLIQLELISHGEQSGGILIPFVRFLLLAKQRPFLTDPDTIANWTGQVTSIAASYEDQLVSDGAGGLVITNPIWMASTEAGLTAPSDYINAEFTMRMLLYELTGDSHELSLAQGLFKHEMTNLQTSTQGWVLLKSWPDAVSWSQKSQAPYGSIYDSLNFDNLSPDSITEGSFFVDALQTAADYQLSTSLGAPTSLYAAQQQTFFQYISLSPSGSRTLVRYAYPVSSSTSSDSINPTADPYAAAQYLQPVNADSTFICNNWAWMMSYGLNRMDYPIGYALRAWARSEAAVLSQPGGQCLAQ